MALIDKLTAIANKIRTLDGTTKEYTLDEMAESVDAANTDIANQSELIEQILIALENKAAGSK